MDRFHSIGNLFQSNNVVLFYPVNSSGFRLFGLAITLRNLETLKCGKLKSNWECDWKIVTFTQTLFYFYFRSFPKHRQARERARRAKRERERRASIFFFPLLYPLALAVNISPAVFYFLSRALDGLRRENRGSVNMQARKIFIVVTQHEHLYNYCTYIKSLTCLIKPKKLHQLSSFILLPSTPVFKRDWGQVLLQLTGE